MFYILQRDFFTPKIPFGKKKVHSKVGRDTRPVKVQPEEHAVLLGHSLSNRQSSFTKYDGCKKNTVYMRAC
jgi:hypothetical protein